MSAAGNKKPLVLLPGFLCDQTVWDFQVAALSDIAACMVVDWGQLGSIEAMAEHVLRVAPERFALAGHSMGGRVAFQVYRMAPDRVDRIALLNTGADARPGGEAGAEEERGRRELLAIARTQGMRAMALKWLTGMIPLYRMTDTVLVEEIVRMFAGKSPDLFEIQMEALLARPDARPILSQIRCPALVLTGADDGWSTPARHRDMAAAIAGARLELIPRSGHMSTMERPADVAEALRAWLGSS
jgi:pimeloyl-ACP methyl ester carboxylesterase